jgi:hypothetical protein
MIRIQHIRRFAAVLAGVACALLASAALAAPSFAMVAPPAGASDVAPPVLVTATVVAGGMPGWQITLIAVGAALLTATAAVYLDRARSVRRNVARTAA